MTRLASTIVVLLSLFGLGSVAQAAPKKTAVEKRGDVEAKQHADAGRRFYALGKFLEASVEFETAYQTRPDGGLLYNAAQTARLGGDLKKARTLYNTYISFHPDGPNVGDAKSHVEQLNQQIQLEETAKKNAPPVAHTTSDESGDNQTAQQSDRPVAKKWWFWTAIIGGAAVVAAAVTLGIVLTRPAPRWTNVNDIGPGASTSASLHTTNVPPLRPLLEAHF